MENLVNVDINSVLSGLKVEANTNSNANTNEKLDANNNQNISTGTKIYQ